MDKRVESFGSHSGSIDEEYLEEPVREGAGDFEEFYEGDSDEEARSSRVRRAMLNDFKRSHSGRGRSARTLKHKTTRTKKQKAYHLSTSNRAALQDYFKHATTQDIKRSRLNDFKRTTMNNFNRISDDEWTNGWQRDRRPPSKRARTYGRGNYAWLA